MRRAAAGTAALLLAASLGVIGAGSGTAAPGAQPRATIPYDLNGDRHPDVVIGAPTLQVQDTRGAGGVVVVPSTGRGLQRWAWFVAESDLDVGDYSEPADRFGAAVASGDFDGDGFADLAIGEPGDGYGDYGWSAGAVSVVYGSPSGPRGDRSTQLGMPAGPVAGARFGTALVAADLDADGFADLAVGAPGVHGSFTGTVSVFRGSISGLLSPGVALTGPAGASGFGAVLAAGNVDGRGGLDLVVGTPGVVPTVDTLGVAGSVSWCAGGYTVPAWCEQLASGVEYAGLTALAVGNVMSGPAQGVDVVVGVPTAAGRAGAVQLLAVWRPGGSSVAVRAFATITQDSAGVRGTGEPGDAFGTTVVTTRLDDDAFADLVIGAPGENAQRGRVTIVRGAATGWRTTGSRAFDQASPGVPGTAERYDRFGAALAVIDANGDGQPDLVVGAPGENGSNGAAVVLRGAGNGFATSGNRALTASGVRYPAPTGASLGASLPGTASADPNRLMLPVDTSCPTVVAVGDMRLDEADPPNGARAFATSQLAAAMHPDAVAVVGDLAITGRFSTLSTLYESTWGRFHLRTSAIPGNHEYAVRDALGFGRYFGPAAGTVGSHYYSWDIGAWHVVALDTDLPLGNGSEQLAWLTADLDAHPGQPIMALTHTPRFSGGRAGGDPSLTAMWRVLRAHGADIVISGHDHGYERYGLQDEEGNAADDGIRQFVVGTGGAALYSLSSYSSGHNLEAWEFFDWAVLRLTLRPDSYSWHWSGIGNYEWSDDGTTPTHHVLGVGCG